MTTTDQHAVSASWIGDYDEAGITQWAAGLRKSLKHPKVSLGLVFMTPRFFPNAQDILEIIRVHGQVPLLAGCSGTSIISNNEEIENQEGIVLGLYSLPGATLNAFRFTQENVEAATSGDYWHSATRIPKNGSNGWLVFADPFTMDAESWLSSWNKAYAPTPVLGGLSSGDFPDQKTQIYYNGDVFEEGGIAISVGGSVALHAVISQGCTPIGDTWTITDADKNIIKSIGNRPSYEILTETFQALSENEQAQLRGNLFVGLVINEYAEDFHRGDFLIRNLVGADPNSGCIAVGAYPRKGQTLQFQKRDAAAASEDLNVLLQKARTDLSGSTIFGACLCCCNGRGAALFGSPSHDAALIQQSLGPMGVSGFFCNGEIGPVGPRNFIHGYTASLAIFVEKK